VLVERIRHAGRRPGQFTRLAARVARLDSRDPLLDVANVAGVLIESRSRMLRSVARRSARCSGVPPDPNSCSKTVRGSRTIGSGWSGAAQLIVSVYTHA
jgi:hypothetical protein